MWVTYKFKLWLCQPEQIWFVLNTTGLLPHKLRGMNSRRNMYYLYREKEQTWCGTLFENNGCNSQSENTLAAQYCRLMNYIRRQRLLDIPAVDTVSAPKLQT